MATATKVKCQCCTSEVQQRSYLSHRNSKKCQQAFSALSFQKQQDLRLFDQKVSAYFMQKQSQMQSQMQGDLHSQEGKRRLGSGSGAKAGAKPKARGKKMLTGMVGQSQTHLQASEQLMSAEGGQAEADEDSDYDKEEEFEDQHEQQQQQLDSTLIFAPPLQTQTAISTSGSVPVASGSGSVSGLLVASPKFSVQEIYTEAYRYGTVEIVPRLNNLVNRYSNSLVNPRIVQQVKEFLNHIIQGFVNHLWAVGRKLNDQNVFDPTQNRLGDSKAPAQVRAMDNLHRLKVILETVLGSDEQKAAFEKMQKLMTESFEVKTAAQVARIIAYITGMFKKLSFFVWEILKKPLLILLLPGQRMEYSSTLVSTSEYRPPVTTPAPVVAKPTAEVPTFETYPSYPSYQVSPP